MKTWDLISGSKKIDLAADGLRVAASEVERYWNDKAYQKFMETYITPLDPRVRAYLDAIQRLAEILNAAERDCGMDQNRLY